MNAYTTTQLAAMRRQQLTADATYYRPARAYHQRPHGRRRRPLKAINTWLAAGQL